MVERDHIETRLLIVSEMLDKAVEELARVMSEIRSHNHPPGQKEGGNRRE